MNNFIYVKQSNRIINKYTIYGERHSGTKLIQKIFAANTHLELTWEYGWKHWIGFCDKQTIINANDTLFVCLVRNPYDWILSFFREPHHVPKENRESINNFLTKQWYSVYDAIFDTTEILDDRNFLTNKRYSNIFDMRKHKIYYMRQLLPQICSNMILLSYETLTTNTESVIMDIWDYLNTKNQNPSYYIKAPKNYSHSTDIHNQINNSIEWDYEKTVGYLMN